MSQRQIPGSDEVLGKNITCTSLNGFGVSLGTNGGDSSRHSVNHGNTDPNHTLIQATDTFMNINHFKEVRPDFEEMPSELTITRAPALNSPPRSTKISISSPDRAPCESNNSEFSTKLESQNVQEAIERYIQYIPRINQVTSENVGSILVEVLKETENEVLLDEFFSLLNKVRVSASNPIVYTLGKGSVEFSLSEAKSKGLALCRLVHDTFTNPLAVATYFGVHTRNLNLAFVNAHEFHRTFLAVKILLHCIKEGDSSLKTKSHLAKTSVFNIYQVYCFRLLKANESSPDRVSSPESLLLGQASIGKVMKMVFANVTSRRLGKRGSSKYHFSGVEFKDGVLDSEISSLLDLDPTQFRHRIENSTQNFSKKSKQGKFTSRCHTPKSHIEHTSAFVQELRVTTPLLSYVSATNKFPEVNFAVRVKQMIPNTIPRQPEWFKTTMLKSIDVLKLHNVNLDSLVQSFQNGTFSAASANSVSTLVISAEEILRHNASSEEPYMHLHLIVLMLVFPAIIASNEEVRPQLKILLRVDLRKLVKGLEKRDVSCSPFERAPSRIFLINLQKLINIGEALSVLLSKKLGTDILKVLISDFLEIQKKNDVTAEDDDVCSRAAVIMLHAHPHSFPSDEQEKLDLMTRIVELFQRTFHNSLKDLQKMLGDIESGDGNNLAEGLPFDIFKLFTEAFHDCLTSEPFILKLPVPVIRFFFSQIDLEIQSANFKNFGKRSTQLSAESFKTWWVITSSLHEYLIIISEIVVLSQRLH